MPAQIFKNLDEQSLRNFEIFRDCPSRLYSSLMTKFERHYYQRGDHLFREGDPVRGIYCIYSGSVKIAKKSYAGLTNIIFIYKSWDVIGLRSAMSQKKHAATATALEPTEVGLLTTDILFAHIAKCPDTQIKIMRLLCKASDDLENRMMNFMQKSVPSRLAETLLLLQESFGTDPENNIKITLNFSEIAALVHTSRFTLYRIFNRWRRMGIIRTRGRKIQIANSTALIKI